MNETGDSLLSVQRYYDRNTRFFLLSGGTARTGAIHRSLWPAGVTRLEDALNASNELLLRAAEALTIQQSLKTIRLADLGCGVGGTLQYLAARLSVPAAACGVTLSFAQAGLAQATRPGSVAQADFHALPFTGGFDFAWWVEALIHSPTPEAAFREAARVLRPGGRLALIDDFLARHEPVMGEHALLVDTYRRDWQAHGLSSLERIRTAAQSAGLALRESQNLTPLLRLRALPHRLAVALCRLAGRTERLHAFLRSTAGSIALQQCLSLGLIEYQMLVFEKSPARAV